jgi:hypothetical protein
MMRRIARFGGVFLVTAVLGFALLTPRPARSAIRNVAGSACESVPDTNGSDYYCSVMIDDSTFTVSALSGATFDFLCLGNGYLAQYNLNKLSYTGSFYNDTGSYLCTANNAQDKWLAAVNVKTNASVYDYVWTTVFQVASLYGVQAGF